MDIGTVALVSATPIPILPDEYYSTGAIVTFLGALGGMFLYAFLRPRLPH
ncbi:MAG: hypothetical protein GY943_31025 [Chloroflexi bacterium]|nr:hypothetical protein [Chloroflexota bacterium]